MPAVLSQAARSMAISTPLGVDAVVLRQFTYAEELGRPFRLTVHVTTARPNEVDIGRTLGKPITIRVERSGLGTRHFSGIVSRISRNARVKETPEYMLTVVPKFWLLSCNADCRIFQKKSVPEIIQAVFQMRGIDDALDNRLKRDHEKHDYLVQYRETDLNFLSRLMEMEGIYYFFTHDQNGHKLVLCDDPACHKPQPGLESIPFYPVGAAVIPHRITDWRCESELRPGRVGLRSYDFKAPNTQPRSSRDVDYPFVCPSFEVFDYPMEFHIPSQAEKYARLRAEELASDGVVYTGHSDSRGIAAGQLFKLTDPSGQLEDALGREYLVVGLQAGGSVPDYQAGGNGAASEEEFSCSFTCIESDRIFRPQRVTPKPIVSGTQTATVVGPKGQEIYTDKHGRVKLQFHWDRYGKQDENSSCWVRVSQPWAGAGWGGVQIPRIGQEVIVDFLEGDPDRPIITGRVYNALSMPPVSGAGRDAAKGETNPADMMQAAQQMTLRSNSLGGSGGHNEITMEDTGGSEKLFIRAQKDEVHMVQNDRKDTVGHDEVREVVNDRTRKVGNNETVSVGVNQSTDVGENIVIKAGTSITLECGASRIHMNQAGFITITGSVISIAGTVNTNMTAPMTNVTGAILLTMTGAVNLTVGAVCRTQAATLASINSGQQAEVVAGADAVVQGKNVKLN